MEAPVVTKSNKLVPVQAEGYVHCPICTHTVPANIEYLGKRVTVVPGQKCRRCRSSLDAAALLYVRQAA